MRKKKTSVKRMVVFIFAVVLAFLMSVPSSAEIVFQNKTSATIDAQLQTLLKDAPADERIPVDIWLYETSNDEEREQQIFSKIGLHKAHIVSNVKDDLSSLKIDEYISTARAVYAEEREQQYALLQQEYSQVEGLQAMRKTGSHLFFSLYAPMISAELTTDEIQLLARDSRVQSIYHSPNMKLEDKGNVSISVIGANYIRDTLGYTGVNVNIGMIESGIPRSSESYFDGANIVYDNISNMGSKYTNHANIVAAIMVGQETSVGGITYKGIVPDATLYVTCAEDSQDWRSRVEWLISQGVHVINMSAGFSDATYYSLQDKWVDHIAINHSVHFVTASGNEPLLGVTSPGMAYNAITVGSVNDRNSLEEDDDVLATDSSYVERKSLIDGVTPTNKPDLVAPGVNITTAAGTDSGTSFAAPHVTAVVAQMCQRRPALKVQQDVMKAILTAAIPHSEICYTPADSDNYNKFGAGVVNADSAYYVNNNYRFTMSSFAADSADGSKKTYTFSVTSSDEKIRVSLSWLKYAVMPSSGLHASNEPAHSAPLANLDLYVYAPDGTLVASSTTQNNNTEIVDFDPTPYGTGTYKITVKQTTHSDRAVYFGLAWW